MSKRSAASAAAASKSGQGLSVIVPCYAEQDNVKELADRLFKAFEGKSIDLDLLFMDDESDGTEATKAVVKQLQGTYGSRVRIHCRTRKEGRGLSSAVILGFKQAKHDVLLCMDADLQHEPESVPDVAAPVLGGAEFSVGSRFVEGGSIGKDWPFHRRLISGVATMLAKPLAPTSDPMSGFFCLRKDVFQRGVDSLQVSGFKISLELMARCRVSSVADVPIRFRERVAGESKLTMKQNIQYLQQLANLYLNVYGLQILLLLVAVATILFLLFKRM